MMLNIHKIAQNPVMLGSTLLLVSSGFITLASFGVLIDAFFYSPTATIYNKQQTSGTGTFDSVEISERNFFGLAVAEPEIEVDNLPETKLALILRGAFMGSSDQNAGAIIENEETNIANNYYVGEPLPGDATLKAIYADRVVLSRNGLLETLYFPDISDTAGIGAIKQSAGGGAGGYTPVEDAAAKQRRDAIRERIKQLRNKKR